MRKPHRPSFVIIILLASLLPALAANEAQTLRSGPYTVRVDNAGRLTIDCGRAPLVTTSYAGMFGRLPAGSAIYWIDAHRGLQAHLIGAKTAQPGLEVTNTGQRGVTLRREATITPQGVRLVHEITVPANVAGSIDTGFTLNPDLAYGAEGTMWKKADGAGAAVSLEPGRHALAYRVDFHKLTFKSQWGTLSIEFQSGAGLQDHGSLLNGLKSDRGPGKWVQVLPLFAGIADGQPQHIYRSVCLISFQPQPGKPYLSPQRNVLYNGDFEAWANPDLPDGWRRTPPATKETAGEMAPDSQVKWQGQRSLRWTSASGVLTSATQRDNYLAPIRQDGPYVFSVYLRSKPAGVKVRVRCGNRQKTVPATTDWQRVAVSTQIKPGAPLPAISLQKLSPGTLWVDAAQLETGDQATEFVARPQATVFTTPPFPKGLLADEIARVAKPPLLGGCGPEFSYYTRERQGRLIYDLHLPPQQQARASLVVSLRTPQGQAIVDQTLPPPLQARVIIPFQVARLPLGQSVAKAELQVGGKTMASLSNEVTKLAPLQQGSEVKTDRLTHMLWRNGAPYIPVGSDASADTEHVLQDIRQEAANGFNQLHLWSGFWVYEKTAHGQIPRFDPAALKRILDAAQAAGMTVTVNLSHWLSINHFDQARFRNSDVSDDELIQRVLEVVRAARHHPAVLDWYLSDEPNPAYCSPEWLVRAYQAVKQEDPYHPADINICMSGVNMLSYLKASDLMSIDLYPVPSLHVGVIAPNTEFMRLTSDGRPIRWWIQAFAGIREPTAAEEQCMTYQALAEGARFILFYNYRPTSYAAWAGLGQIAAEIKALHPALTAEREDLPHVAGDGGRVVASMQQADGYLWIIAVNRDTRPVTAQFTLPTSCYDKEAEVLFESRKLQCQGTLLQDTFAPMARHVYRLKM